MPKSTKILTKSFVLAESREDSRGVRLAGTLVVQLRNYNNVYSWRDFKSFKIPLCLILLWPLPVYCNARFQQGTAFGAGTLMFCAPEKPHYTSERSEQHMNDTPSSKDMSFSGWLEGWQYYGPIQVSIHWRVGPIKWRGTTMGRHGCLTTASVAAIMSTHAPSNYLVCDFVGREGVKLHCTPERAISFGIYVIFISLKLPCKICIMRLWKTQRQEPR